MKVIYVEACEAGSIFEGFLEKKWNIYVTTASNSYEKSWATYCPIFDDTSNFPSGYDTCLGDLYSASWMEDRFIIYFSFTCCIMFGSTNKGKKS